MRFATIAVVLGSAFSAVATPTVEARGPTVVERDLATVTSVLANVMSKVQALDTAVKAYNGGTNVLALQNANQAVISAVNSGVTAVNGSGDLSESDALQLPGPVQQLVNIIKTSISDLEAKKSMLVAACLAPEVLDDLNMQKTSSNALANAITSKVPTALQGIAKQLSGQITTAIQGGITDFTGTPACSSSSSASSSASKTSSSSSASSSASASSSSSASATSSASSSSASASSTPVSLPGGMMTTPGSSTTPVATSSVSVATSAVSTPTVSPVTGAGSLNSFSAPAAIAAIAAVLAF